MTEAKTQTRGICQCCGRQQAVLASGFMSKHGYEVKNAGAGGWFQGGCRGEHYEPLQIRRDEADYTIAGVRRDVLELLAMVGEFKAGTRTPETVPGNWNGKDYDVVPFASATPYCQRNAIRGAICKLECRAATGGSFADRLESMADRVHGTDLLTVPVDAGPAPIPYGDRRVSQRGEVTAKSVDRGMVEWQDAKGFRGRCSTRTWRAFPAASGASA